MGFGRNRTSVRLTGDHDVTSPGRQRVTWDRRQLGSLLAAAVVSAGVFASAGVAASPYDPSTDPYSMATLDTISGASTWWNAGYTGKGIDVAVIDTGVAPVEGLATPGKIINGPDLSFESQSADLTYLDTNGHGTFMAGIIAGKDSTLTTPYASAPASAYRGVAPDARILNMKVGVADGGVDVSQVIAAIDWVVAHKTDNGLNVRVINLSYGTNSLQSASVDPLAYAVEQAWKKGIVVVAAAGNTGYQVGAGAPGLANPAYDPTILAVGGYDTMGTATKTDDTVGDYSASSKSCAACPPPDFVAPGSHLQGLRVPNSFIDLNHPEGQRGERYFAGSGTSQAAAFTSGAVALILEKYPTFTPDQVRRYLVANAVNPASWPGAVVGAGELNLAAMLTYNTSLMFDKKGKFLYPQNPSGTGTGTLEGARGTDHVSDNGTLLTGEVDIFAYAFNASTVATATAAVTIWNGGDWNGHTWTGSSWTASSWAGRTWSGNTWSGRTWSGRTWSGNTWSGRTWSGNTWSGGSWSGSTWSGRTWSGGSWS
jgi:serine protease AprX